MTEELKAKRRNRKVMKPQNLTALEPERTQRENWKSKRYLETGEEEEEQSTFAMLEAEFEKQRTRSPQKKNRSKLRKSAYASHSKSKE
jgi:hypothetical protein